MRNLFFIALCFLVGCGSSTGDNSLSIYSHPVTITPPEYSEGFLKDAVMEFQNEYGIEVQSQFFWVPDEIQQNSEIFFAGKCFPIPNTIWLAERIMHNPEAIRQAVFHELGHCELGLDHDERKSIKGRPVSLMHPHYFIPERYLWDYYKRELLGKTELSIEETTLDDSLPGVFISELFETKISGDDIKVLFVNKDDWEEQKEELLTQFKNEIFQSCANKTVTTIESCQQLEVDR